MTDAELNAATEGLQFMLDGYRDKNSWEGYPRMLSDGIAAIADLRAQLAEARAELHGPVEHLSAQDHANVIAHLSPELEPIEALPNRNSLMMALVEATNAARKDAARADRAEAALAAQIEADAGMIERIVTEARQEVGSIKLSKVDAAVVEMLSGIAKAIRNQPHDRTALDRHDAKTREKALREAAKTAHECNMAGDPQASSTYILALIEKPNAR